MQGVSFVIRSRLLLHVGFGYKGCTWTNLALLGLRRGRSSFRPRTRDDDDINRRNIEGPKRTRKPTEEEAKLVGDSETTSSVLDDFVRRRVKTEPQTKNANKPLEKKSVEAIGPVHFPLSSLQRFAARNKFPNRNTFLVLATGCASDGDVDGIRRVRDVCATSFPDELDRHMNFRHCEAEATWKDPSKRHREALRIFTHLFKEHPSNRRKLINQSAFCLRDIVRNEMSELYPDALAFAVACYRMSGTGVPAANLWRVAFCSESFEARCLSNEVLNSSEGGEFFKQSVADKIPSVIREARENMRPDTLQRLMELVLSLDMKQLFVQVIGAYIEYLCEVNDVRGALETFRYIRRSSVYINSETAEKLMTLLMKNGRMVPLSLLNLKYNQNGKKNIL